MKVFFEGAFGAEVAALVCEQAGFEALSLLDSAPAFGSLVRECSFVAAAAWRNCPAAFDQLDQACFRDGTPWMPVFLSGRQLFAGPVIRPGQGACYGCFRKRFLTHHPSPERELVLSHFYDRDRSLGPHGFIQPMAWLAASFILDMALDPASSAGQVLQVDLLTGTVLNTRVVRVHGCERCGSRTTPRTRFVSSLIPELERCLNG